METLIAPTPRPRPPPPPPLQPPRPFPSRDDLWSEPATFTLIKAWANHRHIAHSNQIHHNNHNNDGAHRQSHWKLVADAVNAVHGHSKKSRRTDVQCKNRIDTIKKKYKAELARIKGRDGEGGDYVSPWPFFDLFHSVVSKEEKEREKKAVVVKRKRSRSRSESLMMTVKTPLIPTPIRGPRSAMSKRPAVVDGSFFRRNFGAAAAVKSGESDGDDEEEEERENGGSETEETIRGEEEGCRELARAITRFGEVYERVEVMKQERLVELEKQRMQFLKDLEYQRMKLLMDTHWFGRRKRAKGSDDAESSL